MLHRRTQFIGESLFDHSVFRKNNFVIRTNQLSEKIMIRTVLAHGHNNFFIII